MSVAIALLVAAVAAQPATTLFEDRLHASVGASGVSSVKYGDDGYFQYGKDHFVELEVGWARALGEHLELGIAYTLTLLPSLTTLHRVPFSARYTLPLGYDTELGIALRLAPMFASSDRITPMRAWGASVGPRLDLRHWFGGQQAGEGWAKTAKERPGQFGLVLAVETWWALASVSAIDPPTASPHLGKSMTAYSLPTVSLGGIVRF